MLNACGPSSLLSPSGSFLILRSEAASTGCASASMTRIEHGRSAADTRAQGGKLEPTETSVRSASAMKRIVIVADNSLIVEAIRVGLRRSGEFSLVGHADPRRTSAST